MTTRNKDGKFRKTKGMATRNKDGKFRRKPGPKPKAATKPKPRRAKKR